ncbi:MAG: hypothetical protein OXH52_03915 [Gammaproteobacteria bacterium]|nr:hypothetical protein [Gammaproteobacteria bacterium]
MRELTSAETEHAAGGLAVTGAIALSVGGGLAAAYLYEKIDGAAGIERMARAVWDALVEGATVRAKLCQRNPIACTPVGF